MFNSILLSVSSHPLTKITADVVQSALKRQLTYKTQLLLRKSKSDCKEKMPNFKTALVQMNVCSDKRMNLEKAKTLVEEAAKKGAKLVALPECFNSPYGTQFFKECSESVPDGPTSQVLQCIAQTNNIYLVGGTIPESDCGKIYNTCTVWSPKGELLAKYRKMHLFDIDIPGSITFKESDILNPGNEIAMFHIETVKIGLGICYDMRFEELAKVYRLKGAEVLIYPGAFNMTTGPIHWELLQRSRANDNQVYVCAISPARSDKGYIAWGHSQITDPWGKVLAQAKDKEEVIYADINLQVVNTVRAQIPIGKQRRCDVFDTVYKK